MPIGFQTVLIYSIVCFLKTRILLNVKVVPNHDMTLLNLAVKEVMNHLCLICGIKDCGL